MSWRRRSIHFCSYGMFSAESTGRGGNIEGCDSSVGHLSCFVSMTKNPWGNQ